MTHDRHQKCIDAYDRAATRAKRVKLHHDSSSEPSTVSEDSALIPTSVPDDTTEASDVDSDLSSDISDSSDEPSDESSDEADSEDEDATPTDEETVVNLRANRGKKPVMKLSEEGAEEDIRPFLKDFLPKLKAANKELEAQKAAGTLETVEVGEKRKAVEGEGHGEEDEGEDEGEEQYIELNLGLGVLEAKDSDASDEEDGEDGGTTEKDILGKLMGRGNVEPATSIQVVEDQGRT